MKNRRPASLPTAGQVTAFTWISAKIHASITAEINQRTMNAKVDLPFL
jgi:hypothetical protein